MLTLMFTRFAGTVCQTTAHGVKIKNKNSSVDDGCYRWIKNRKTN